MKELVEKLAREAQLVQMGNADQAWTTEQCDGVLPETLERFAQLVATKCAEICERTTEEGALDAGGETKAYASAAAIRQRFCITEQERKE